MTLYFHPEHLNSDRVPLSFQLNDGMQLFTREVAESHPGTAFYVLIPAPSTEETEA